MDTIYEDDQTTRTVLVLSHGRVRHVAMSDFMAPAWVERDLIFDWSKAAAGEDELTVLAHSAVIIDRIAPGVPCYVVPGLSLRGGGAWGGYCMGEGATFLAVNARSRPWDIYHMALHEAWHAMEHTLTDVDYEMVRDAVQSGVWTPRDGYYDLPCELTANSFAAWACGHLSLNAVPCAPAWSSVRTVEMVFGEVLAGTYGKREAARPSLFRLCMDDLWWLASSAWNLFPYIRR